MPECRQQPARIGQRWIAKTARDDWRPWRVVGRFVLSLGAWLNAHSGGPPAAGVRSVAHPGTRPPHHGRKPMQGRPGSPCSS
jgi:hypothetical protein